MTKEQLWEIYCSKNPSFRNPEEKITLTARGLKKMFEQTWNEAEKEYKEEKADFSKADFGNAFKELFGKNNGFNKKY